MNSFTSCDCLAANNAESAGVWHSRFWEKSCSKRKKSTAYEDGGAMTFKLMKIQLHEMSLLQRLDLSGQVPAQSIGDLFEKKDSEETTSRFADRSPRFSSKINQLKKVHRSGGRWSFSPHFKWKLHQTRVFWTHTPLFMFRVAWIILPLRYFRFLTSTLGKAKVNFLHSSIKHLWLDQLTVFCCPESRYTKIPIKYQELPLN